MPIPSRGQRSQLLVRVPDELLARVAAKCTRLGVTRTDVVIQLLERWADDGSDAPPLDTAIKAVTPQATSLMRAATQPTPPKRMTMDDVRPAFTPRLKKK